MQEYNSKFIKFKPYSENPDPSICISSNNPFRSHEQ